MGSVRRLPLPLPPIFVFLSLLLRCLIKLKGEAVLIDTVIRHQGFLGQSKFHVSSFLIGLFMKLVTEEVSCWWFCKIVIITVNNNSYRLFGTYLFIKYCAKSFHHISFSFVRVQLGRYFNHCHFTDAQRFLPKITQLIVGRAGIEILRPALVKPEKKREHIVRWCVLFSCSECMATVP